MVYFKAVPIPPKEVSPVITFRTKPELHMARHLGIYRSYGIFVFLHRRLILHIPDVFCERDKADEFVRLCNAEQPELIHLEELIEDTL